MVDDLYKLSSNDKKISVDVGTVAWEMAHLPVEVHQVAITPSILVLFTLFSDL